MRRACLEGTDQDVLKFGKLYDHLPDPRVEHLIPQTASLSPSQPLTASSYDTWILGHVSNSTKTLPEGTIPGPCDGLFIELSTTCLSLNYLLLQLRGPFLPIRAQKSDHTGRGLRLHIWGVTWPE